ncbi:hypothetical protein [Paucilactobacillus wasatchensis]|uniref:Uncharacterized protein n=1 Tax=Paucilactobacillus wasatchensis TaxID=1335616 RepID=A0A0D1A4L2_9LACO|nr:hypothetical protein [Paucilactobacillus wasatchensis]KIS02622.1 hypothetical protein WDC_1802 [Paucilactobacillus wasatchensis]
MGKKDRRLNIIWGVVAIVTLTAVLTGCGGSDESKSDQSSTNSTGSAKQSKSKTIQLTFMGDDT